MRTAVRNLVALALCVLTAAVAQAAMAPAVTRPATAATRPGTAAPQRLLAYGAEGRFWVARVSGDSQAKHQTTTIHMREAGDSSWRWVARIPARVETMTSRGGELTILLESGDWMTVWRDGSARGPALPDGARMVMIAGGPRAFWAVGLVPGGKAGLAVATTRPAATTGPATTADAVEPAALAASPRPAAATRAADPQTRPAALKPVLFSLSDSRWNAEADLPNQPLDATAIAMHASGRAVTVALSNDAGRLVVHRLAEGVWSNTPVELPFVPVAYDIIEDGATPLLWATGATGPGVLLPLDAPEARPIPVTLPQSVGTVRDQAIAVAGGRIRLLFLQDGKLFEQVITAQGAPQGEPAPILATDTAQDPQINYWINLVVFGLLILILLSTARRRETIRELVAKADRLNLAPLGSRLLAGLVDLFLPTLVVAVIAVIMEPGLRDNPYAVSEGGYQWYSLAALAAFIAHTTIGELATGRSLGKWLFGLRVVGLDGKPAPAGAVLIRNLLRIVDVATSFVALLFVPFSPLRQRIGDIAAGTLVIQDRRGAADGRNDGGTAAVNEEHEEQAPPRQ